MTMKSFDRFLALTALLLHQVKAGYYGSCAVRFWSSSHVERFLTATAYSVTASRAYPTQIAPETTSITGGIVSAVMRQRWKASTAALLRRAPRRIKTVPRLHAFIRRGVLTNQRLVAIFADIAQACANRGNPITAVPAEATFSATSGGTLFGSVVGSAYSSCVSGGLPGNGRGKGPGNGYGMDGKATAQGVY